MLTITITFTTDEAEFLTTMLTRSTESVLPGSAERFWLERLHNRVQQAVVAVVAGDSAARLAASAAPRGFSAMPPPPPTAPFPDSNCVCGSGVNSVACLQRKRQGIHP